MSVKYELRHLRHFIAVAEELNFRAAAEHLNFAQPALSRSIRQLEEHLTFDLFVRTSRKVKLTKEGEIFLKGAYQVMATLSASQRLAQRSLRGEIDVLRIGHTDSAIIGILPTVIAQFKKVAPDVKLDLLLEVTNQQIESVYNKKLDIGFVTGPIDLPDLRGITVHRDNIVAVISEHHPLADRASVAIHDLKGEGYIMGNDIGWQHFNNHINSICMRHGFRPNVIQAANNTDTILSFISANIGITLHLSSIRNYVRKGTVVLDIHDIEDTIPTQVIWRNDNLSPVLAQLLVFIREKFSLTQH
ncbi:LysR substrate-binding domain-containing protein [Photobacterium sp. ZSDE20]|uniref:LysR substrate-binding domain-containing protein n=1 Tax=Photobacterium pectinilyticum TaxID=2906793 RepID=A0ABT1N7S6_9GAMM|nr:LysR substrate-binding domain-containing protein [Photobacterium sp. ZSDE20]MCQ1060801.1 LysR substrate-binding domain-containing protein [Photobacterium sp. ZSDE20]MDD1828533.1 LysR substrate-binding domain-containing protein [Photobacterium sp. ZSDE20]